MHKVENSSLKNLLVRIQLNIKIKNNYLCNDFIVIYFLYKILSLNLIFIFSYYFDIYFINFKNYFNKQKKNG